MLVCACAKHRERPCAIAAVIMCGHLAHKVFSPTRPESGGHCATITTTRSDAVDHGSNTEALDSCRSPSRVPALGSSWRRGFEIII